MGIELWAMTSCQDKWALWSCRGLSAQSSKCIWYTGKDIRSVPVCGMLAIFFYYGDGESTVYGGS